MSKSSNSIIKKFRLVLEQEDSSKYPVEKKLTKPDEIAGFVNRVLALDKEPEEVLYLLCLDRRNMVIGYMEVGRGTSGQLLVHPREIFKRAILANASRIILVHNHPDGNPAPSTGDIEATKRVAEAGELVGIELLDHIITGDAKYKAYSSTVTGGFRSMRHDGHITKYAEGYRLRLKKEMAAVQKTLEKQEEEMETIAASEAIQGGAY